MKLKMSQEEKIYLDQLVAISGLKMDSIREVLRAILISFSIGVYAQDDEIIIPYIGKFKCSFVDKFTPTKGTFTKVILKASPCESLTAELSAINEGDLPPSKDYFQNNVLTSIRDVLEIEESDLEDV